jgi:urease subunit gamma/beta
VKKHFTSSILLWMRTDQPRQKGMDHWKGPHSGIIAASPGLQEYRQIHLAEVNPGLKVVSVEVPAGQTVPRDRSLWNCDAARGRRLNIAAGTSVRFEPGDECCVELVQIQGEVTAGGSNTSDLAKIQGLREGIVR